VKICIVGAGAIGGFIGTRLALAGRAQVCALARGPTLAALRQYGWRLEERGELRSAPARAAEDAGALGVQDAVVVAVKGPALPQLAPTLAPLLGPATLIVPAMNGVPWWFVGTIDALGAAPLASVDPAGVIAAALPLEQVIGCVVHVSASTAAPGLVSHLTGHGLIIGEARGGESERVRTLGALLAHAGFEVTCSPRVRYDIWYKLWGNMTANPVSALTGATMDRVLDDELVRRFITDAMTEAAAIGERIGCGVEQTPADRHAITRRLGAFKTSMLQDVEAGRALELDILVGAVREIGARVGVPTPSIDTLFGLARLFARVRGLYPQAPGAGAGG
jgi:2-dehydropantoate 2-reductase